MKKNFELHTKRLVIKPIGIKYLDTVDAYARDPENTKYMLYLPNDSREATAEFLKGCDEKWADEDNQVYECAIILEGVHVGAVSLYIENGVAEFGWILDKHYWGQGITFEAAESLKEYVVKELGIRHFIAHCDSENRGSYRVMEKLGMEFAEKTPGRKNKMTPPGEERFELMYKLDIDE